MPKKTPIDKLADAVSDILSEYGDDVQGTLDIITKRMGSKGVSALKQQSRAKLKVQANSKYVNGWKYEFRKVKRYAKTTIFNEHYSLPHLLEHGHALRGGGRSGFVEGREHIAPVETKVIEQFERELINDIQ